MTSGAVVAIVVWTAVAIFTAICICILRRGLRDHGKKGK